MSKKSMEKCQGCRNDFYNDKNPLGVKACWSLKKAKVVTRYRIGWWTTPSDTSHTKVRTYDCHHAPGKYAMEKSLPVFHEMPS